MKSSSIWCVCGWFGLFFYSLVSCFSPAKGSTRATIDFPFSLAQDTTGLDSLSQDSLDADATEPVGELLSQSSQFGKIIAKPDLNALGEISESLPAISLEDIVKGQLPGLYIQEPSGEPGTERGMLVRGLSSPVFNVRDSYINQPIVYLNGIPLLQENPYAYDVQYFNYNRIGPATNLLATIDKNNIKSIQVITDPVELAKLGPLAANGAIWITTENAASGLRSIKVNSYVGMVQASQVTAVNASYENQLRQPFYQKYAPADAFLRYPDYLSDSTSAIYYGKPDWAENYYQNAPVYSIDMSLSGGSESANFRFFGAHNSSRGNADETGLDRYAASFFINMKPADWLTISSMLNGSHLVRDRNRSVRDRLAEARYIPDLSGPIAPNSAGYMPYLNQYDDAIDNNLNTLLQGYFNVAADLDRLKDEFSLSFDYNQGIRDVFWPSELMDGNNYMSGYFGYNQRFRAANTISYTWDPAEDHQLTFESGQSLISDVYKYNYNYAYRSPNDFIKIRSIDARFDSVALGRLAYRYTASQRPRLASLYGKVHYQYKDILGFTALLRTDGSSNAQPANRWFMTPAFELSYNIRNHLLYTADWLDQMHIDVSWARVGKLLTDDRYAVGAQYRVDMSWPSDPVQVSYQGVGGLSRPYTDGWIGYGLEWPYSDKMNLGIRGSLAEQRVNFHISAYNKDDRNQLLKVPVISQSGYTGAVFNGMWVNNRGVDGMVSVNILTDEQKLLWTAGLNFNYNKNKLKALPRGRNSLQIGERLLQVGHSIDQFWLLENNGVYENDIDVPVHPDTYQLMNYEGVPLRGGDPIWKDKNGDYVINSDDRQLLGNSIPNIVGGFNNRLAYRNWSLNFQFYFALGHELLNQYVASKFDFINRDGASLDINSVREITYWQKDFALEKYPLYNPWSDVVPYRAEQDIFLQNASFMKLRSLTLGYDLSEWGLLNKKEQTFKKCFVYVSGYNLLTISSFKGGDPELVGFNGYYSGYGLPIPRTFTLGVNIEL